MNGEDYRKITINLKAQRFVSNLLTHIKHDTIALILCYNYIAIIY